MWSYGLDLTSIRLTVVKVVVSSEGTFCLFVYPSSSSGWRYGMNGNSGSCRQLN